VTNSYTVIVKDTIEHCTASETFTITQPDSLQAMAKVSKDTCGEGNGSVVLLVTGGTAPYSYLWSNNTKEIEARGLIDGIYTVAITDSNSCNKDFSYIVEDTCVEIMIHDVITPNGDGTNDVWVIEGIQNYPENAVQIFDKWGTLLYEKTNYDNAWGGKSNKGELLPDGTYYYLVKLNAKNAGGGKNVFTGSLLIKR
jgi:gliding motility-associated-like protein